MEEFQKILSEIQITKVIGTNDFMNWILGAIGGILVFKAVDNMQTNMERHNMIKDIEVSINNLFSEKLAKCIDSKVDSKVDNNVTFRTVLHDQSAWDKYIKNETCVKIEDSQRYVCIRYNFSSQEYVATQALHETLILFRRIEKLYKSSILKPLDLSDLWREILPFGTSGRLEFFKSYFSEDDIMSLCYVILNTVVACKKYKLDNAVTYFMENKSEESINLYTNNKRLRKRDFISKMRFEKIINERGALEK